MLSTEDPGQDIHAQAARWEVLLNDPGQGLGDADRVRFQNWLLADERHAAAFREISGVATLAAELPAATRARLSALAADSAASDRAVSRRQLFKWGTWAAAAAIVMVVGGYFIKSGGLRADTYATRTGETRVVTFEEGSVAYLNTRTKVRWLGDAQDRRVALVEGQVLFDVVHDESRPFRVMMDDSEIRVRGTRFNVYRKTSGETIVTVLEGTVEVRGYGSGATHSEWVRTLQVNQQIAYRPIGLMNEPHETVAQDSVKWRDGLLRFEDTPLPDVVQELTRYTDQRIVIRDPSIAGLRVGGSLSTVNVRRTLEHLKDLGYPVELKESDGTLTLESSGTAADKPRP